jgi:hypothetical protein
LREAQEGLAQAPPATMASRLEGSRYAVVSSRSGEVAHRWGLLAAAHRPPQAQRTVETPWRQQRAQAVNACKTRCRTALAGAAEAQQALTRFGAGWPTTVLHARTVCPSPHDGKRGRPGPGTQPEPLVAPMAGALASRLTDRRARLDQQSCFIRATHALDEGQ